jgi:O-antigen ligase
MRDYVVDPVGWAFLVAVCFAPLFFGANVPLAWGLNAVVFSSILVALMLGLTVSRRPLPVPMSRLDVPLAAFAVVLTWIFLQAQTWFPAWLHHPAWSRAGSLVGAELDSAISANVGETLLGLLRLTTAVCVFLIAVQLGRDPAWARRILVAVAAAGAVHAIYALALAAMGPDLASVFLSPALFKLEQGKGQGVGSMLSGFFVNRNHLAIYLALALVAAWGLFMKDLRRSLKDHGYHGGRETVAKLLHVGSDVGLYSLVVVPIAAALLLTTSRAALFLSLSAILVVVALEQTRSKSGNRYTSRIALGVAAVGLIIALTARGDLIGQRIAGSIVSTSEESRWAAAMITWRAAMEKPLVGWGYGAFANVFPSYRDDSVAVSGTWLEAHNSYMEAMLGLGIPVAIVLWVGLGWIAWRCFRGAVTRRQDELAPQVAFGAFLIVAVHALVDFSLQIQGIALTFAAIIGAGVAQSWSTRAAQERNTAARAA